MKQLIESPKQSMFSKLSKIQERLTSGKLSAKKLSNKPKKITPKLIEFNSNQ